MIYRKEIDGLRAFSVIPVILFHAGFEFFSGGYIGVDVFFVISGYLITSIILEEIRTERFSIKSFYERRARRILPAFIFVSAVTIPFAWELLAPKDLIDYSESLIGAIFFSSNLVFWFQSGYFDIASELKPMLHTWSLAVEEQYYILFPLVLIALKSRSDKIVLYVLVGLFLLSFAVGNLLYFYDKEAAFFLLPARAWEILAGSLVAMIFRLCSEKQLSPFVGRLDLIGFILIIGCYFGFDHLTPTSGVYTFIAILGAVLVILFSNPGTIVGKLLANKHIVYIGLLSYSLYLWHQPVLVFSRHLPTEVRSEIHVTYLFILIFILSYLTYRFVETPLRKKVLLKSQAGIFKASALSLLLLLSFPIVFYAKDGFASRFNQTYQTLINDIENQNEIRKKSCVPYSDAGIAGACSLGNPKNIVGVIAGDSHARALWKPLDDYLKSIDKGFLALPNGGCPPLRGLSRLDIPNNQCYQLNEKNWAFLLENDQIEYVILNARWTIYLEGDRYDNGEGGVESGKPAPVGIVLSGKSVEADENRIELVSEAYKKGIDELSDLNKTIFLIYPLPEAGWHVPRHLKNLIKDDNVITSQVLSHSYDAYLKRNQRVIDIFESVDSKENLVRVNSEKLFCNKYIHGRCITLHNGVLLYRDDDHLTNIGAEMVINEFKELIK